MGTSLKTLQTWSSYECYLQNDCRQNLFSFPLLSHCATVFNHELSFPSLVYRKKHLEALEQLLNKKEYTVLQQHLQVSESPQICQELNNTLKQ